MKPGITEKAGGLSTAAGRVVASLRSGTAFRPRWLPVAASAAFVWALTFVPGLWAGAGAWAVRAACAALWVWLAVILDSSSGKRPALAAPLFLIVTSALWLYALIPVLFAIMADGTTNPFLADLVRATLPHLFPRLVGSEGELSVLRFALAGIAVMAWAAPADPVTARGADAAAEAPPSRWMVLGLGVGAGAVYAILGHASADPSGAVLKELLRQVRFAALVLFTLAVALAGWRVTDRAPGALWDFIVLVGAAAGVLLTGGMKSVVFIFGASVLAVALTRRSLVAAGAALLVPLALLLAGMAYRTNPESYDYNRPLKAIVSKVVTRQIETVDCLTGVIRKSETARAELSDVFYFAGGLVPRVLWPGKPDLSRSGKTVLHYCDPILETSINEANSGSATLLWEPLVHGGAAGQIVAQALNLLILAGLSRAWIRGGPYAAAGVLALSPWAIDFDQHFALYIANLAKSGLVVVASLFAAALIRRVRLGRSVRP